MAGAAGRRRIGSDLEIRMMAAGPSAAGDGEDDPEAYPNQNQFLIFFI